MKNCFLYTMIFTVLFGPETIHSKELSNKGNIAFIENRGQIVDQYGKPNPSVFFIATLKGMNVQLRKNGFSYDTYRVDNDKSDTSNKLAFHRVDVSFEGANPSSEIIPGGNEQWLLNFYTVESRKDGILHALGYRKVTYKDIYPGIDLEFTITGANEPKLEYNFIIHPLADASKIRMKYAGGHTKISKGNQLVSTVLHGEIIEDIPRSYIEEQQQETNVQLKEINKNVFGFEVPNYDRNKTLIIDPIPHVGWATYYGHTGNDAGYALARDHWGNLYMTGFTNSPLNIATTGAFQSTFLGGYDMYVSKFDSNGVRKWATYFGGSGSDIAYGIAVGKSGNVVIAGPTNSAAMATPGAHQMTLGGLNDVLLAKFDSSGARIWSTYYGGADFETIFSVTLDTAENVIAGGTTYSNNSSMISTPGAHQGAYAGAQDMYLAKFDSNGILQWSTYLGGVQTDQGIGVSTDPWCNIFLLGDAFSSGLGTQGTYSPNGTTLGSALITKFSPSGQRIWATYFGGPSGEASKAVATDRKGNVHIVGLTFSNSGIASPGASQQNYGGNQDVFLAKFDSSGQRLWSTYCGGADQDIVQNVGVDTSGDIYIVGNSTSTSNISSPNTFQFLPAGGQGATIIKYDGNGNKVWGTYLGGNLEDKAFGLAVPPAGGVFVSGVTSSTDLSSPGSHQQLYGGGVYDGFLMKVLNYDPCTSPVTATTIVTPIMCYNDSSGSISVSNLSGGVPPYIYAFNGAVQPSYTVNNLPAGSYTIHVRDSILCYYSDTIVIPQPQQLTATATSMDALCNGSPTGSITVNVQGGTPPYFYSLNGAPAQNSNFFPNLYSTLYNVVITDNNSCDTSLTKVVNMLNVVIAGNVIGPSTPVAYSTHNYSVPNEQGANYLWSIIGGTIVSGQNTSNIVANWGISGPGLVKVIKTNNSPCTDSSTLAVSIQSNVGVENVIGDGESIVYPNPANTHIIINTHQISCITITNTLGEKVVSRNINGPTSVDISFLIPGLYFLSDNKSDKIKKFVKQ